MATVFLNGTFMSRAEAKVSAFDAGLQHGVGLFETMMAVAGASGAGETPAVRGLWEHLERLKTSAMVLGLMSTLNVNALAEAVNRTVKKATEEHADTENFRVRLSMTGGDLNLLERGPSGAAKLGHEPTLLISVQPATVYPPEMFERGVRAVVADLRVNPLDPFQGHKTINYWPRLRELQRAAAAQAGEALVFQVSNHLAGGAVSNAFILKDGMLHTPIARGEEQEIAGASMGGSGKAVMPSPVLPGITRAWVLERAADMGVGVQRRMITVDDVLSADELFLTNSSWGVLPVVAVEAARIGEGAVGEFSAELIGKWGAGKAS